MTTTRRPAVLLLICVAAAGFMASCGSDSDGAVESLPGLESSIAAPTTDAPTTDAPSTSEATTTTTESTSATTVPAATTTLASTTTVAGPPTLKSNGIGRHEFGGPTPDELIGDLSAILGSPTSVVSNEYPNGSAGYYDDDADEFGFVYRSGRTACFSNALCVEFGGDDAASLRFVGYRQNEGAGSLTTASGVTAGSAGSAFPAAIVVDPGGCFSTGMGTADGVRLYLRSDGELFGYSDEATDTFVIQTPPVDDIVVLSVLGGDEPYPLYDDC